MNTGTIAKKDFETRMHIDGEQTVLTDEFAADEK